VSRLTSRNDPTLWILLALFVAQAAILGVCLIFI
jgi:hypothetical protein